MTERLNLSLCSLSTLFLLSFSSLLFSLCFRLFFFSFLCSDFSLHGRFDCVSGAGSAEDVLREVGQQSSAHIQSHGELGEELLRTARTFRSIGTQIQTGVRQHKNTHTQTQRAMHADSSDSRTGSRVIAAEIDAHGMLTLLLHLCSALLPLCSTTGALLAPAASVSRARTSCCPATETCSTRSASTHTDSCARASHLTLTSQLHACRYCASALTLLVASAPDHCLCSALRTAPSSAATHGESKRC